LLTRQLTSYFFFYAQEAPGSYKKYFFQKIAIFTTMISLETHIPKALSGIVKCFWRLHIPATSITSYQELIIPDGHHEIILHLNEDQARRQQQGQEWRSELPAFLTGQTTEPYLLEMLPGATIYGIRFYPFSAAPFLQLSANETTDQLVSLQDLTCITGLMNCLQQNAAATFAGFEKILASHYNNAHFTTNRFSYARHAVSEILKTNGMVKTKELVRQTGISQRYLDSLFKQYVGITPKALCRIIQLNYFIYHQSTINTSLTRGGYEAGFYDQSHLIKTFKSITAQSPKAFFQNNNYINTSFSAL
jgi:methylphosphotriester-DNA--protein-cysteine methyltransferase